MMQATRRTSWIFVAACLLGAAPSARVMAQEDVVEEFDCETYLATAPVKTTDNGEVEQPYLTLDTNDVKTWNLGASMTAGFACSQQLASCCCPAACCIFVWLVVSRHSRGHV